MDRIDPSLWWYEDQQKFLPHQKDGKSNCSNYSKPIRTLRAFKRFLRKHTELQGREVRLVNRYVGFDIIATYH